MGQSIQEWTKWNVLNAAFHKVHLVLSWILYPICSSKIAKFPIISGARRVTKILKDVTNLKQPYITFFQLIKQCKLINLKCKLQYFLHLYSDFTSFKSLFYSTWGKWNIC